MNISDYWNNKHPKRSIIYQGRAIRGYDKRIPIDVRNMIFEDDDLLKGVTKGFSGRSNDELAWSCQRWIVRNIRYVGDKEKTGIEECWQYPNETLVTLTGDCEDGAILMASLMLNCGIPSWRVRVTAGLVKSGKGAETGGHAYVTYCRESDNNWVILDWCYYEDSARSIKDKPIFNKVSMYKEIWFSFNNLYSWSNKIYEDFRGVK